MIVTDIGIYMMEMVNNLVEMDYGKGKLKKDIG